MTAGRHPTKATSSGGPLTCPLPRLDGVDPQIFSDTPEAFELGYPGHTRVPRFIPVFAMASGTVRCHDGLCRCSVVEVTHGDWATRYAGLGLLLVPRRSRRPLRVEAGDILGYLRRERPRIHVELGRVNVGVGAEPRKQINNWSVLPWFSDAGQEANDPAAGRACAKHTGSQDPASAEAPRIDHVR